MIKVFEKYASLRDANLSNGDKVIIKYRDSKYFMQTGKIVSIINSGTDEGDIRIMMDFSNDLVTFYFTNILKIEELVEMPSGEILNIPEPDAIELAYSGLIHYNKIKNYYFFDEADRWQIESYAI